jgi:hypothetical protein
MAGFHFAAPSRLLARKARDLLPRLESFKCYFLTIKSLSEFDLKFHSFGYISIGLMCVHKNIYKLPMKEVSHRRL